MTIVAWIVLGLIASIVAQTVLGAKYGTAVNMFIGVAGAALGGLLASVLLHVDVLRGFVHVTTWITAIVGSLVLLLIGHAVTNSGPNRVLQRW